MSHSGTGQRFFSLLPRVTISFKPFEPYKLCLSQRNDVLKSLGSDPIICHRSGSLLLRHICRKSPEKLVLTKKSSTWNVPITPVWKTPLRVHHFPQSTVPGYVISFPQVLCKGLPRTHLKVHTGQGRRRVNSMSTEEKGDLRTDVSGKSRWCGRARRRRLLRQGSRGLRVREVRQGEPTLYVLEFRNKEYAEGPSRNVSL